MVKGYRKSEALVGLTEGSATMTVTGAIVSIYYRQGEKGERDKTNVGSHSSFQAKENTGQAI
jgi:hypothetical protein